MGEQLALPRVSLEQRSLPDPVILAALAKQGAPMRMAFTLATAATMGATVEFFDWDEHDADEHPVWIVRDVPASMHAACSACMNPWISDDSWFWLPDPNKVPRREVARHA
jgi:hypothetical protein